MTDNHPITPPPELVMQWATSSPVQHSDESWAYELFIAHQAARWGADQELEACCEWILRNLPGYDKHYADYLRKARRPKPPTLKEQALEALEREEADSCSHHNLAIIRRALEQLDD